jgi:hypothetical protein
MNRECSICGCTDDDACVDQDTGERCHWIIANNVATCSFCAEELGAKNNLVQTYSEADARQFLKARSLR